MSLISQLFARWGSGAAEIDEVRMDPSTNSLQTVDYAHHEIHAGSGFSLCVSVASMSGSGPLGFSFTTPNTTSRIHLLVNAYTAEDGLLTIREAGTPAGGSGATPINRRRDGTPPTSGLTSVLSGITATGGTVLCSKNWGSTGAGSGTGNLGSERDTSELVLAQNTSYQITLSGTQATPGWLELDWYEHTDQH
jgi:hypothetical protein